MRGKAPVQPSLIVLMNPEDLVPRDHPLRKIKTLCDAVLREQGADLRRDVRGPPAARRSRRSGCSSRRF